MSFWKFIRFIIHTLVSIIIISYLIMSATTSFKLTSPTTKRGIIFSFNDHPDPDHNDLAVTLNAKYRRNLKMTVLEMKENERVFTGDGNGEEFINPKVIEKLKDGKPRYYWKLGQNQVHFGGSNVFFVWNEGRPI